MTYVLITAATSPNAPRFFFPSASSIDAAMNPTPGRVGPARIVRRTEGDHVRTFATILVNFPDQPTLARTVSTINALVNGVLQRIREQTTDNTGTPENIMIWDVNSSAYDPAVNGPLEWWRQNAANTTTRNDDNPQASEISTMPPLVPQSAIPGPTFQAYVLKENSVFSENSPSFETLREIFRRLNLYPGVRWLGPDPRVTRFRRPPQNQTYAVWVAYFPDRSRSYALAEQMRNELQGIINNNYSNYSFEPVVQMDIDTRFGLPSFWTSGQAVRTHTAYDFQNYLLQSPENPYGPDDPALRPATLAEWTAAALNQAPSVLWPVVAILAIAAGLYMVGPAARAVSLDYALTLQEKRAAQTPARTNPTRKRRKARSSSRSRSSLRSSRKAH